MRIRRLKIPGIPLCGFCDICLAILAFHRALCGGDEPVVELDAAVQDPLQGWHVQNFELSNGVGACITVHMQLQLSTSTFRLEIYAFFRKERVLYQS